MLARKMALTMSIALMFLLFMAAGSEGEREKVTELSQLEGKVIAVPVGTVADQLVHSGFPNAVFQYYDTALDACLAVKSGMADAAAYDKPILMNIAAKIPGLVVLPDMITRDDYGFAVRLDQRALKETIDQVVLELRNNGKYDEMLARWLPEKGAPGSMPEMPSSAGQAILRFGTAAVTEPFSFVDENQQVTGFDVELAKAIAQKLGMQLEIILYDFGGMIPALVAGEVDMIGACITITPARAQQVLFSEPYFTGGIAALVAE
ncbi:MAG: transporter substrate-binding domain-containing protein [Christensenellales bacterium]